MASTRIILLSGASSGMGKGSALRRHHAHPTVCGAACRVAKMQDFQDAGRYALQLDLTNDEQMKKAVHQNH